MFLATFGVGVLRQDLTTKPRLASTTIQSQLGDFARIITISFQSDEI